ncbi:DUF475 domain-containing protein [Novosphingobium flavum]|uniref:DUF475 domain-containing protein n=1 Tax=Novosphingobium aerophilum TaxID=2839843 RepID=A0A7X1KB11_9SPHN|nr:DUF475 domain-containing protein [Novosphingobium aerophilum]MBC2650587.1 DUF475 domain-containing protein [Novosphingobium aerophilum]MBC2660571.1 DUF475 domain-containing protein [Novosphingobium aerophilum]
MTATPAPAAAPAQRPLSSYFAGSVIFTLVCLGLGAAYGWTQTGTAGGTLALLWIVVVLSVLEISLSFDNAVVNAAVLETMDPVWRRRFLTWGMVIAVFGMRVLFPLAIVGIAARLGPLDALRLSLNDPVRYEAIVSSAHIGIAGFGGAFLAMVGLSFFFDEEKDIHWIKAIEQKLSLVSNIKAAEIACLLLALYGVSLLLETAEALTFLVAGILGIAAFIAVEAIGTLLEMREAAQRAAGIMVRSGLSGFLYLNVLDASFSFDGVIGAFALSNNMVIIALGLSIGAMFVRSLTILLVERGTLAEYRYLEHGAFWAILALGGIMLLSARFAIPETVTGLIGAVLIVASLAWSIRWRRRHGSDD